MKSSNEIRQAFLDFFTDRAHTVVPSSPLVPADDPTLLFTNAGMVQFKEHFLGTAQKPLKRAASSQRCVRAGGKHNDLDNVGYTARHHTFFEMLGNFSFGDYFKREAIGYAWEFITEELAIPAERTWITVFRDDDEAANIWTQEIGVDPARVTRCDEKDNFWAMGDTGPCGPCSEIFFDHGPDIAGGPPGIPEADGDRYVEIWNLVFPQFDRHADGTLDPLEHPGIDTGMGLERIAAVLQGVHSNYDIDLFQVLLGAIDELTDGAAADRSSKQVIADHIRSCAFLITDGVSPANDGRGYVLRRIIRRAARHGNKLGLNDPFFYRLVGPLNEAMGAAYPELGRARANVEQVLRQEEERFAETLSQGLAILDEAVERLQGKVIAGEKVFQLYDTYGFPVDLTADVARERGLSLDMQGFEREMEGQRTRARAASQFSVSDSQDAIAAEELRAIAETFAFTGYEKLSTDAQVIGIYQDAEKVNAIDAENAATVLLDKSPFYAESGGQVGDRGILQGPDGVFEILDTRKQGSVHLHVGKMKLGNLTVGDRVEAQVDPQWREPTRLNHSATHLMHAALRKVLGEHVTQKGSLVAPDRLRFDFSHSQPLVRDELDAIERSVNEQIRRNSPVDTQEMSYARAVDSGALALFGEKYEEQVRVLNMGDFSIELCGGTHAARTGDIGLFKIVAEGGVASGVRRIEALTGHAAFELVASNDAVLRRVATLVKGSTENVEEKVALLTERSRAQEKEIKALQARLATQGSAGGDLTSSALDVSGIKVLAAKVDIADAGALRDAADEFKSKLGTAAVVLGAVDDTKVRLVATISKDATDRLNAGKLVNFVATQVGGKGGGRPDMAQAGGSEPAKLDVALASVGDWVREQLG